MKTLKDFIEIIEYINQKRGYDKCKEELKQEVIKWIKEDIEDYRNAVIKLPKGNQGIDIHNFIVFQRRKWKKRFNIKEKDLK